MEKNRLEAFSDGVIAIIITIMVLDMKVPHGEGIETLVPLIPVFLSYILSFVLSFVYLGIYWHNHYHMLYVCRQVTGPMLWANLHLLFWLSLIPFAARWMGENHFAANSSTGEPKLSPSRTAPLDAIRVPTGSSPTHGSRVTPPAIV